MANLIRSAKSGSDWSNNDLKSYNITISSLTPNEFFPTSDLSLNHIDPAILNSRPDDASPALSDSAAQYLGYLDFACRATQQCFIDDFAQQCFIDDFVAETLKLLGFDERHTTVSTHHTIPLNVFGGSDHVVQVDVCLIHRPTLIPLVLIGNNSFTNRTDTEAQVVAEAVAAFQFNNEMRGKHGLLPLDIMTIPCITMTGTRPTFYLIPVTTELSDAVITGRYPATRTQVLWCVTMASLVHHANVGMEDEEYRKLALKHFLAFKELAKNHWVHVLEGVM